MSANCDIVAFAERDIDVWLAEELRFNAPFCRWFLEAAGVTLPVTSPAWRVQLSVVDDTRREADVQAWFHYSGGDFVLFIENKINAIFQPEQMEDYLARIDRGVQAGTWAAGQVGVFAPTHRTLTVPDGIRIVRFGAAARALEESGSDDRSRYRADFLRRADQPGVRLAGPVDERTVAFWLAVDEMLRREFAGNFLTDRQSFPKQTWVNPRWPDMPAYLRLDLKGQHGEVDLAFRNFSFVKFAESMKGLRERDMELVEHGKSSALRIGGLPPFTVYDGVEVVDTHVRDAYLASKRLVEFWRRNRIMFDALAAEAMS